MFVTTFLTIFNAIIQNRQKNTQKRIFLAHFAFNRVSKLNLLMLLIFIRSKSGWAGLKR